MVKKRASKDEAIWQGMVGERVDNLIKAVDELKTTAVKGFEKVDNKVTTLEGKVDTKFVDLTKCVNNKFDKHNLHHEHQDKKYLKYLFILSALVIGSLISNPNGLKFVWSVIKIVGSVF